MQKKFDWPLVTVDSDKPVQPPFDLKLQMLFRQ